MTKSKPKPERRRPASPPVGLTDAASASPLPAQARTERMRLRRVLEDPAMAHWNAVAATNLRRLRLASGLSAPALAERIGVSVPLVQQHERGRSRMNAGQVKVYANVFGVEVGEFYLVGGERAGRGTRSGHR